ncbi:hypothetical protein [Chryseobacterium wanjuense]
MVQAENEFGLFAFQRKDISKQLHRSYVNKIVKQIKDVGFNVPMYTSDVSDFFEGGYIDGALPAANGEKNIDKLKTVVNKFHENKVPLYDCRILPGLVDALGRRFSKNKNKRNSTTDREFSEKWNFI